MPGHASYALAIYIYIYIYIFKSHASYALAHPMPSMLWPYIYPMPVMLYALAIYYIHPMPASYCLYLTCQLGCGYIHPMPAMLSGLSHASYVLAIIYT